MSNQRPKQTQDKVWYKKYCEENKERIAEKNRRWRERNIDRVRENQRAHVEKNKDEYKKYHAEYRLKRKEKTKQYSAEYRKLKADKIKRDKAEYYQKNKPIIHRKTSDRFKNDPNFRIATYLRKRLKIAIKNNQKTGSTLDLLGCSVQFFKDYIAKQFKEGMTWENRGRDTWHIDHKKPIASFDLSDPEQQKICFHHTNMQPLFALENLIKGKK